MREYLTSRNAIKTAVNLIDSKFKKIVYDPFCGARYIRESNIIEVEKIEEIETQYTLWKGDNTTARITKLNIVVTQRQV